MSKVPKKKNFFCGVIQVGLSFSYVTCFARLCALLRRAAFFVHTSGREGEKPQVALLCFAFFFAKKNPKVMVGTGIKKLKS
jgi:hypothetical protein